MIDSIDLRIATFDGKIVLGYESTNDIDSDLSCRSARFSITALDFPGLITASAGLQNTPRTIRRPLRRVSKCRTCIFYIIYERTAFSKNTRDVPAPFVVGIQHGFRNVFCHQQLIFAPNRIPSVTVMNYYTDADDVLFVRSRFQRDSFPVCCRRDTRLYSRYYIVPPAVAYTFSRT